MPDPANNDVTALLLDWSKGDRKALDRLVPLVYAELHQIASRHLRRESGGHMLQSTALVNEAYLRLVDQNRVQWQNRAHFFGVASQMIRRILVDHARAGMAAKRGGAAMTLALDDVDAGTNPRGLNMVALDRALDELARIDPEHSRLVELRFFGGLSIEETAEILRVSPATVKRDWAVARAWLFRELTGGAQPA